jgi:dihydrofolate reductase
MTRVVTAVSVSVDGYIAGPEDGPGNPLGDGGQRLFEWYADGDTPSRIFPRFRLSAESARVFDDGAAAVGAIIAGRRTYEISSAVPQALAHDLLDQMALHQVPVLLGGGVLDETPATLELRSSTVAPGVTHLTYEVVR